MNKSRIIICGHGASGKNELVKRLVERGNKFALSTTTRPPRPGEKQGEDYNFITQEEFTRMVKAGEFYQFAVFNGHSYGTSLKEWNECNVFIMTVSGINQISTQDMENCFVIFLDISETTRRQRLMERHERHEPKVGEQIYLSDDNGDCYILAEFTHKSDDGLYYGNVVDLHMPMASKDWMNYTNDATERRLQADKYDFEGFNNFDIRITNPDF